MTAPLAIAAGFDLVPHRTLGRYELLVPLARGGMAMVWAARLKGSRGFEKLVAVKTMLPGMSDNAEFERMFLDEATLAARIRHPHVVEILDLGEEDRILYIVMEWIEGEALNVIMNTASSRGGIPVPIGVRIVMQACAGLHAAHELEDEQGRPLGLVHRDVSPQNILVTYGGVTKVADFGIAKAMARGGGSTAVGEVKGKVAYMAPEQALGNPVDRRADVFGLGILLYQLATGSHPFRGDTDAETFAQIALGESIDFPRAQVPDYPPSLEAVLLKALAKDPDQRYESANALLRALDKALPPSMRGSVADEEVGAFVRSLLGEARELRSAQLAAALREAELRLSRNSRAQIADTIPPPASGLTDTHGGTAFAKDAAAGPGKKLILALGVAVLAIGAAGALLLASHSKNDATDGDTAGGRALAPSEPERPNPGARIEPSSAPSAEAPSAGSSSLPLEASATAAAPPAARPYRPHAARSKSKKSGSDQPPKSSGDQPSKSGGGATAPRPDVSPVRSPGF
jgi:eukaryotic-like serine/threonine-protein kinase